MRPRDCTDFSSQSHTGFFPVVWVHRQHQWQGLFSSWRAPCKSLRPSSRSPRTLGAQLSPENCNLLVEYQLSKKKSCLSQEIKITELVCNLLIDEPWYSFDASPSRKTPYSRLCDPLDVVPQHLQPGAHYENTKDRVLRKSLLYLSVSLCSPLPKAFAPLAPPVIGHSSPFSSFLVRSEFRLLSDPFRIWTRQIPLVCFGPRDCHYAITLGRRKSKKWKCFDQWERSGGETTNGRRLSVCGTIQLPGIRYACLE